MDNYSVEVKPSARKELEELPDKLLARVVRKLESLANQPTADGMQES